MLIHFNLNNLVIITVEPTVFFSLPFVFMLMSAADCPNPFFSRFHFFKVCFLTFAFIFRKISTRFFCLSLFLKFYKLLLSYLFILFLSSFLGWDHTRFLPLFHLFSFILFPSIFFLCGIVTVIYFSPFIYLLYCSACP